MRSHWLVGFGLQVDPADPSRGAYSKAEAWIDLIMECRYAAGTVVNGGRRMEIKAGQLVGATSFLASRWNWTPKTTRVFLDKLEADGMIERFSPGTDQSPDEVSSVHNSGKQRGKQASVITICKYGEYQVLPGFEGQAKRQAEGKQGASKGQAEGNTNNKGTKEQGNKEDPAGLAATPAEQPASPPPASPADLVGQLGLDAEGLDRLKALADPVTAEAFEAFRRMQAAKTDRAQRTALENARRKDVAEAALAIYNKAAVHFNFSLCESFTEKRRARLIKRIEDIGGVENFRQALRAIGKDSFLSGKVSRPGHAPFRLDFDRLLSTDSKMGDVLARLFDLANQHDRPQDLVAPNGKSWGWWRPEIANLRTLTPDYWQRRFDALKPNGAWPWWELGPPPGHSEMLVDWDEITGTKISDVYRGEVEHA